MATIGSMVVKLIADAEQFQQQMAMSAKTLRGIQRQFERTARNLERMGQSLTLGITAPMALIGGSALKMAMEAEEAHNLFVVTMGDMVDKAQAFSQQLLKTYGLATDLTEQQQAAFYRQFKTYGLVGEEALKMAQNLTMVTNDLASFVNMDPTEVMERLLSGMRGETDAVERLGISLADAIVKQTAYRHGLAAEGSQLTETQKQLARYLAIMEQTKDAQGDLARTLNSPTNQVRILKQQLLEAQKALGRGLLPFLEAVLPTLRRMATALQNAANAFRQLNPAVKEFIVGGGLMLMAAGPVTYMMGVLSGGVATVVGGLNKLARFGKRVAASFATLKGGTITLGSALVAVFGTKLRLVIAGIATLAASAILLIANWRSVADAASRVWSAISGMVLYAASLIVRGVSLIVGAFAWIIPALRPAADAIRGWADSLKGAAQTAWTATRAASTVQQVAQSAQQTAQTAAQAAQAQESLGQSMESAAKNAEANLQSFDQVHQIQEQMAESPAAMEVPELGALSLPEVALPGAGAITDLASTIQQQMAGLGESVSSVWARIGQAWDNLLQKSPLLRAAVDGINSAFDWIRTNWPTIGPIVEGIASLVALSLVPALIRAGLEATIAGGRMVAAWAASGASAVAQGAKTLAQLIAVGAKWVWMGAQAVANGVRMAVAWGIAMGPVGWVIAAIAAVGAALVVLWHTNEDFRNAVTRAWEWIKARAAAIWDSIQTGLKAVWDWIKVAGPAAWDWLKMQLLPLWNAMRDAAANIWGSLSETLVWLWGVLKGAGIQIWTELSTTLSTIWTAMKDVLLLTWQLISTTLQIIWQGISTVAMAVWTALQVWWQNWGASVLAIMSAVWEQIKTTIETAIYLVRDIVGLVLALIRGDWEEAWNRVKNIAQTIWDWICATAKNVGAVLAAIWQGVSNTLADLWDGIKTTAENVWKGIANGIIRFINGIINGINRMIEALNRIHFSIPDWVPVLGGKSFGFNLKTISTIPYLAAGGNIVGSGFAVVGEAGPELVELPRGARVTPLSGSDGSDLVEAIAEAVYAAVQQALQPIRGSGRQEVVLELDGQRFARLILPALEREGQRTGSPVVRLQGV